jgi:hypothetical protein
MKAESSGIICRSCVAALAILIIFTSQARSGYLVDVGSNSCDKWMEARKVRGAMPEVMHTSWIYGYLSSAAALLEGEARAAVLFGMNNPTLIEKAEILNPKFIDANAINAWLDNYCHAHPLERLTDAASVLLTALKEKTGYLRGAVCETSDLQEEGRARCFKALEATNRAVAFALEDAGPALPILNIGRPIRSKPGPLARRPQGRPTGEPQTNQPTNQTQFMGAIPAGGPSRYAAGANSQ